MGKVKMKKIILAIVAIAVLCGFYCVNVINSLVVLDENVKSTWSQVLNQYERRVDLIPNLVNTVKGYAAHEETVLKEVIEARAKATSVTISVDELNNAEAIEKFQQAQGNLSSALSRLMAVAEQYPDLKADENFLSLQSQLEGTENRIAVARKDYVEAIRYFNIKIRKIPNNWIAQNFTELTVKETFEIEQKKKEVPVVQF